MSLDSTTTIKIYRYFLPALFVGLALTGCSHSKTPGTASGTAAPAADKTPVLVQVTQAHVGPIEKTTYVTGVLTALNNVTVGAKSPGKLVAVYFREGDSVHAGQVVAQLDTADLQAQLDQQHANLNAAIARLDQAREQYHSALTSLQLTRQQTQHAIAQAQAALNQAKEQAKIVEEGARSQDREQARQKMLAAKAAYNQARSDLQRYENLYRQNAISAQQLDQAQTAADQAQANYISAQQAYDEIMAGNRPEEIKSAQYNVQQAEQALQTAIVNKEQVKLRQEDVKNALAAIQTAKAEVSQAQAAVRYAQQQLEDTTIVSPISGVVAARLAEPGEQVAAGKSILQIVSLDNIYYDAQLPEGQFERVRVGQPVQVTVDALLGKTFWGRIAKIFPVASSQARSFTVRIALPNASHLLRPQMFARGTIVLDVHPRAILVPYLSVINSNGEVGTVFVVQNNVAHQRKVRLGFITPTQIEILDGISAGEKVVSQGQLQLQDGMRVQIEPATSEQSDASSASAALSPN